MTAIALAVGVAFSQEAAQVAAATPILVPTVGADLSWLSPLVTSAAAKYPVIVTILLAVAALRVVFKPFFSIWHFIAAHTQTASDDAFLQKVENSRTLRWTLWALDFVASIKLAAVTPTQKKILEVQNTVADYASRL